MATENDGRIVFEVKYMQQRGTNRWKAEIREPSINRIPMTEDATQIIARWEGETAADEKHATILVSVKGDRGHHELSPALEARIAMSERAREIADLEFRKRHPDAEIEHGER